MVFWYLAADEVGNGFGGGVAEFERGGLGGLEQDGAQVVAVEVGDGLLGQGAGVAAVGVGRADRDEGVAPGLLGGLHFFGGDRAAGKGGGGEGEEQRQRGESADRHGQSPVGFRWL